MDFLNSLIGDTTFWVAVSTVVCFAFLGIKAFKPIVQGLDARANAIRERLDEADALRAEAAAVLEEYKAKSENALHEAQEILENAQRRADQLRAETEAELADMVARQEANARLTIGRIEQETIEAVKASLIEAALVHVKQDLNNQGEAVSSLDKSLEKIVKTLH